VHDGDRGRPLCLLNNFLNFENHMERRKSFSAIFWKLDNHNETEKLRKSRLGMENAGFDCIQKMKLMSGFAFQMN
jgi:hypothetical protein